MWLSLFYIIAKKIFNKQMRSSKMSAFEKLSYRILNQIILLRMQQILQYLQHSYMLDILFQLLDMGSLQ